MTEEELQRQIESLRKENAKLSRQVIRLQNTLDRNKAAAASRESVHSMWELERQKQESYMRMLLEYSPDIILMFDKGGRFAYCTNIFLKKAHIQSFAQISGRSFEEVFSRFAATEWVDSLSFMLHTARREGVPLEFEEVIDIGGEGPRTYKVNFMPMRSADSRFRGSAMMMHDITEIRAAQAKAEEARAAAEQASMAKSEFLSNMSHEMRTPMNAIIGMTMIAKSSTGIERKDYCLNKISEASSHLLGVINDILDMSKIEANKFDLAFAEFNFEKMLQKTASVISYRMVEKQQEFTVQIDKDIPRTMFGDEQHLAQVITNLLANAVKFTPEQGAIHLNAHCLQKEGGMCTLRIEVTDTGIGISREQQKRLFSSFQQADSSISRKFGGTGLGLAISKRIVEMMGGTIWVDSEPGRGATFSFIIQAEYLPEKHPKLLRPDANWRNIRVIAVDDAAETREYFGEIASQIGIGCDLAASGEEAQALIERNGAYDIYFVDWKMPGMDGLELSRQIRQCDGSRSVVIMISGAEWGTIQNEAKRAGVDRFLSKPLFPSAIIDCITECLGMGGLSKKSDSSPDGPDDFSAYHVLLAEDVELNREIVISLLEPTGLVIDCAENGREAVQMFTAAPDRYDMVFMDVQMPEMDGYEATRRIRALSSCRTAEIPIIAMTANVFREDIEKCLEAGMNDHVGKPLNLDEVLAKLRHYLQRHG